MLDEELKELIHDGCPNRHHCKKDESKCCYLVNDHCIIGEKDEHRQ